MLYINLINDFNFLEVIMKRIVLIILMLAVLIVSCTDNNQNRTEDPPPIEMKIIPVILTIYTGLWANGRTVPKYTL